MARSKNLAEPVVALPVVLGIRIVDVKETGKLVTRGLRASMPANVSLRLKSGR